jgi:protein phosphatase
MRSGESSAESARPELPPAEQEKPVGVPTTREEPATGSEGQATAPPLELEICLQSHPGLVRSNNEDRGVYKRPGDPELATNRGTLVIVADGMGGASAGEVASEMAIRLVPEYYYAAAEAPALALKQALENASAEIHRTAQSSVELRGMGTTCVAVAIIPPEVYMAYVGDTRLYLLRDGGFYQLSEDHSVVFEMVRKGIITREQARRHEERNVLSLSMGGRPEITASFWDSPMISRHGDRLLICSDGLHDLVSDDEMRGIILDAPVDVAVHNLLAAANLKGGVDNITAALIHIHTPRTDGETESKATREVEVTSSK